MSVSVIIPAYNAANTIANTLRSVFDQKFQPLEIVVVDDGSTDATCAVVQETYSRYGGNTCLRLLRQPNGGVSRARNQGLAAATGEYVVFLDSDDLLEPDYMQVLLDLAHTYTADSVACAFDYVDPSGKCLSSRRTTGWVQRLSGEQALWAHLGDEFPLWTGSVCYRRGFLQEHALRFRELCPFGEDQEFIIKAIFHARTVVCTDRVLCHYVQHSTSVTQQFSMRQFDVMAAYRRLAQYLKIQDADRALVRHISQRLLPRQAMVVIGHCLAQCRDEAQVQQVMRNKKLRSTVAPLCWPGAPVRSWVAGSLYTVSPRLFRRVQRRVRS